MNKKPNVLWKIYFLLMVYSFIHLFFVNPTLDSLIWGSIDGVVSFFLLVSLLGFCFQLKILNAKFWQVAFPVCVGFDLIWGMLDINFSDIISTISFLITLALILPIYIAMYRYAFKCNEIW